MHDDSNLLALEAEEPARLDHFEPFVHHRRGVDRILRSHSPGRDEPSPPRDRRAPSHLARRAPERATRRGQHERGDARAFLADQTLEDRTMLAVDRQKTATAAAGRFHEQRAGSDDQLLVCDGDVDAAFDRGEDRFECDRTVGRGKHDLPVRSRPQRGAEPPAPSSAVLVTATSNVARLLAQQVRRCAPPRARRLRIRPDGARSRRALAFRSSRSSPKSQLACACHLRHLKDSQEMKRSRRTSHRRGNMNRSDRARRRAPGSSRRRPSRRRRA